MRLYAEATRASSPKNAHDFLTTLLVNFDVSCIKSEIGDHEGALADYEKLSPLVQIVARQNPLYFYLYHNELAIELAELGRFAEAEAASAIAIASPFARAYPEWSATHDEIATKRKSGSTSVVAIHRVLEAAHPKPDRAINPEPEHKRTQSKAIAFHWLRSKRDSFQRATAAIAETVALNQVGMAIIILYLSMNGLRTRGPPALSQRTCPPLRKPIVDSVEGKTGAEKNQAAIKWFCAKSHRSITSIGSRVSLCLLNYLSRGPPLGKNAESKVDWLIRFEGVSFLRRFKAGNPQHFQSRGLDHPEVNPYKQIQRFQRIRVADRPRASVPTLRRVRSDWTHPDQHTCA